jgi:hypothetical protein
MLKAECGRDNRKLTLRELEHVGRNVEEMKEVVTMEWRNELG